MKEKVGIIYSPGFGAGWSTWGCEKMALDQELAHAIEEGDVAKSWSIAESNWPDECKLGLSDCKVLWVKKGTLFSITEYDGNESIEFAYDKEWQIA